MITDSAGQTTAQHSIDRYIDVDRKSPTCMDSHSRDRLESNAAQNTSERRSSVGMEPEDHPPLRVGELIWPTPTPKDRMLPPAFRIYGWGREMR
jgi:hypothetical protein